LLVGRRGKKLRYPVGEQPEVAVAAVADDCLAAGQLLIAREADRDSRPAVGASHSVHICLLFFSGLPRVMGFRR